MTAHPRVPRACALALVLAACAGEAPAPPVPARHERWGIFRDLVLIARSDAKGGPYFLDRFEVSRRDYWHWLDVSATPTTQAFAVGSETLADDDPSWQRPATRIDLAAARAYARWRWCRLPTRAEWEHAASAGGAYRYPWGDYARAEWANTSELGLGQPAAIGTFESGRSLGGPYDLVGNVAEWTESLSDAAVRDLAAAAVPPALRAWLPRGQPAPTFALAAAAPRPLPRQVVGGGFLGLGDAFQPRPGRAARIPTLSCAPAEWSDTTGVRLAADPRSLLVALMREPEAPDAPSMLLLRAFLAEPAHHAALVTEFEAALARVDSAGPLVDVMRQVLRP